MRSFWSEPFLWIHLSGLAVVPLSLQLLWLGLAVGDPLSPFWLELLLVGVVGIVPILWMQWTKPFDIFSLLIVAQKPDSLTSEQQRILRLFKNKQQRPLSLINAILMGWVLWQLYQLAPLAAIGSSILPQWRVLGLVIAAIAFLITNLFFQISISVLAVFLVGIKQYEVAEPYSPEKISQEFTIPGFRVKKILPLVERNMELSE